LPGETKERWKELCMRAIVEQDPNKFAATIQELIQALDESERARGSANGSHSMNERHDMNERLQDCSHGSLSVYDRGIWWS
jgi:hypothetical protein